LDKIVIQKIQTFINMAESTCKTDSACC